MPRPRPEISDGGVSGASGAVGMEFTWMLIISAFIHQLVRNMKKITNMGSSGVREIY